MQDIPSEWIGKDVMSPVQGSQFWDIESRKVFPEQEDRYSRTEIGTLQLR